MSQVSRFSNPVWTSVLRCARRSADAGVVAWPLLVPFFREKVRNSPFWPTGAAISTFSRWRSSPCSLQSVDRESGGGVVYCAPSQLWGFCSSCLAVSC